MKHLKSINYVVFHEKEVDSTNLRVRKLAKEGAPEGTVLVADAQSAGMGRRGRSWASEGGHSVYMSILLRPDIPPENASMLTLVIGLSVAQVCRRIVCENPSWQADELKNDDKNTILQTQIKWPNDVVVSGKKVCGILTEMGMKEASVDYVVAGIGINVNAVRFPEEIRQTATSLALETGRVLDREALVKDVLEQIAWNYESFLETKDLTNLIDAYNEILVNKNREIRVLDPKGEYRGVAVGINKQGELLVEKEDGTCVAVYAGEVSVRGIYGYV